MNRKQRTEENVGVIKALAACLILIAGKDKSSPPQQWVIFSNPAPLQEP